MAYDSYTKIQFLLLILSLINMMQITNAFVLSPKVILTFRSDLPKDSNLLKVHCQSKDDDIGVRTLNPGDQFSFSFRMNIFGTTLFHCNLVWGSKHNHFEVFNQKRSYCYGRKLFKNIYCTWLMKDSGIYLALGPNPSPSDFHFLYPWL